MGPGATECDARGCGRLGAWLAAVLVVALAGCAVLPRDVPSPPSHAWGDPDSTPLGRAAARQLSEHPGRSGLRLLPSGLEALAMRAGLAENAQRTLDLQYYAVHEDITTQLLLHRVLRAAQRGVRVRLLVDDLHAGGRDLQFAALAADPKVEVRVFNPFAHRGAPGVPRLLEFLHDPARLNRRMHNKLWIADNAAAIVGGRNLGDAYFDAGASLNFSDLDVLAAGPVVRELSASFDSYWNSPWAVPIEAFADATGEAGQRERFQRELQERLQAFRDTPYARAVQGMHPGALLSDGAVALVAADAVALYDPPSKSPGAEGGASSRAIFSPRLRALLEGARQEILLISPYLIPAESGMAALAAAVSRGVRVRILTNSLASTDVPAVHGGYARLRPRLLAAGAELHEMRAAEAPDSRDRGASAAPAPACTPRQSSSIAAPS